MYRDIPRLGTVKGSSKWHFAREDNFQIETYCGERNIPMMQDYSYNDWIYGDGDLNACDNCREAFDLHNEEVTELNSMFNIPDDRLAPAAPDTGFVNWLVEADRQAGHIATI